MDKALIRYITTFAMFTLFFVIEKPLFMAFYPSLYSLADAPAVMWHGLAMDMSMAAYLTVIPALLTIWMLCSRSRVCRIAGHVYFAVISVVMAAIFTVDTVLYGYWDFKLDMTPLFYFTSSPSAAMASAGTAEIAAGLGGWLALSAVFYAALRLTVMKIRVEPVGRGRRRARAVGVMAVATALLFVPIRGGVTVSTMNISRAYFSADQRLNHAAVNPAFSLLYSATHQSDFGSQYRYMDAAEAAALMERLTCTALRPDTTLLATDRPDIWIIIAESFSSHLMPSQGGEAVAVRLDSIAREGLLFTRFYAGSFRTDRALTNILSAFPGVPSTSVMKFVDKAEHLPSIPRTLVGAGYDARYFYGGDANFTNMLAYLVNCGFGSVMCDKDFSMAERAGKWGAPDHILFDRVLAENRRDTTPGPRLRVVQTSSSHEPFEVPYRSRHTDIRANAFAYADSCIGAFVDSLARSPRAARTLVMIVPDHYGAYPPDLATEEERHRVPLILTGGALRRRGTIDVPGSQADIAATLLGALGLDHSAFTYSKDMFDSAAAHYAFYTSKSRMGLVTPSDTLSYNLDTDSVEAGTRASATQAKAILQTLYDNLSNL